MEFFRAVPVLIMMIFAFGVYAHEPGVHQRGQPAGAVVTGLTLYNGAVVAELVRSGVFSLPKGQAEAGLSIGLTRGQTLRSIQLPQALTAMLPGPGRPARGRPEGLRARVDHHLPRSCSTGPRPSARRYANTVPAYIVAAVLFIVINYPLTTLAEVRRAAAEQPGPHDAARHDGGAELRTRPRSRPALARVWIGRCAGLDAPLGADTTKGPVRCGPGPPRAWLPRLDSNQQPAG